MGVKIKDIVGLRFGRLVVNSIVSGKGQQTVYLCTCDCGNDYETKYRYLTGGTQSCGCLQKEALSIVYQKQRDEGRTHGGCYHPYYGSWKGMVRRGNNPDDKDYYRYGAIGRDVCDRWLDPIAGFWNFVEDMGPKEDESFTLDRIDNSKGYYPENCRWTDKTTQVFNRDYNQRPGVTKAIIRGKEKWRVQMSFQNKRVLARTVNTYEEAVALREEAELKYYGEVWSGQVTS